MGQNACLVIVGLSHPRVGCWRNVDRVAVQSLAAVAAAAGHSSYRAVAHKGEMPLPLETRLLPIPCPDLEQTGVQSRCLHCSDRHTLPVAARLLRLLVFSLSDRLDVGPELNCRAAWPYFGQCTADLHDLDLDSGLE